MLIKIDVFLEVFMLGKLVSLVVEVFKSSKQDSDKWENVRNKYKDLENELHEMEKLRAKKMQENSKK
mgnify:CR=1 FL=1